MKSTSMKYLAASIFAMVSFVAEAGPSAVVMAESKHMTPTDRGFDIQLEFKISNSGSIPFNFIRLGQAPGIPEPLLDYKILGQIEDYQIVSPQGWTGTIVRMEESDLFSIHWWLEPDLVQTLGVTPGTTKGGFMVLMKSGSAKEISYLSQSTWSVQGKKVTAKNADVSTPVLKGRILVTRSTSGNDILYVKPELSATDDLDPKVKVVLEAITAKNWVDPDLKKHWPIGKAPSAFLVPSGKGQVYTLTYSGTDASGKTSSCWAVISADQVKDSAQPCLP